VAHVALTGGSSARGLYAALRAPDRQAAVPWSRVHLWWGDERMVPTTDPESNAGLAIRELLAAGGPPVPRGQVHAVQVAAGNPGAWAAATPGAWVAADYAEELRSVVAERDHEGLPCLDVILLGVGGDGHVLSVFPDSPALAPGTPLVMAVDAPAHIAPHLARVTLSPRLLGAARHLLVMASGAAKAEVVARIVRGPRDPGRLPAQLALRPGATWLLDRGSAAGLVP
jgi:6-phosphogluconolactonase